MNKALQTFNSRVNPRIMYLARLLVGIKKFNQLSSGLHNLLINPGVKKLVNKAFNGTKITFTALFNSKEILNIMTNLASCPDYALKLRNKYFCLFPKITGIYRFSSGGNEE